MSLISSAIATNVTVNTFHHKLWQWSTDGNTTQAPYRATKCVDTPDNPHGLKQGQHSFWLQKSIILVIFKVQKLRRFSCYAHLVVAYFIE